MKKKVVAVIIAALATGIIVAVKTGAERCRNGRSILPGTDAGVCRGEGSRSPGAANADEP